MPRQLHTNRPRPCATGIPRGKHHARNAGVHQKLTCHLSSLDSVEWSSDDVKKLFAVANEQTLDPNRTDPPTTEQQESSSTPVGAIAGGVVGGVAALLIILAIVWYLRRRKNKRNQDLQQPEDGITSESQELSTTESKYLYSGEAQEAPGSHEHHELHDSEQKVRGDVAKRHELDNGHARQEFQGWGGSVSPVELDGGEVPRR